MLHEIVAIVTSMSYASHVYVVVLLAALAGAPGASGPVALEGGLFTASPTLLGTGLLLGPQLAGDLRLGVGVVGVRAEIGFGVENDLTWRVKHTELRLLARGGLMTTLGRADLSVGASFGVLGLSELRSRHQAERLMTANLDATRSAWSAGPLGGLDATLRLYVYEGWALSFWGGPTLTWLADDFIPGWMAGMSIAYTMTP